MRRYYDIVTGILLILSIIDFTLAAPVLVQEKRQAHVDVAHVPKDVITVLEKRLGDGIEKASDEIFKSLESEIPVAGKPSAPNSASSTANPESSCLGNCFSSTVDWMKFLFSSDYPLPVHDGFGGPVMLGYGTFEPYLPVTHAPQPERPWISPSADPD